MSYPNGKISSFGGPSDEEQEKHSNLAFTTVWPYAKKGQAGILEWIEKLPKPFRYMFLPTSRVKMYFSQNPSWRLFAALNPNAKYFATRETGASAANKLWDSNNPWWTFTNLRTGKSTTAQRIDWGPAESTGRKYDLSPGAYNDMVSKIDDTVSVRQATPQEVAAAQEHNKRMFEIASGKSEPPQGAAIKASAREGIPWWLWLLAVGGVVMAFRSEHK